MSTAANVDLVCDQGADFGIQVYWTDPANNGYTVLSPMRMDIVSDVGTVVYSFITNDQMSQGVTPNILYNQSTGLIQLTMSASETNTIQPGSYSYDLFVTYQDNTVTMSTRVHRLLYGSFTVQRRTTKSL